MKPTLKNSTIKSYLAYYWIAFSIFTLTIVANIFIDFFPTNIFFPFFMIPWFIVIILNFIEGKRLTNYLRENHKSKWEELTTIPFLGPGNHNGFRMLSFLFSKTNLNDNNVTLLKRNYKLFMLFALTVFISMPIFSFMLSI